MVKISKAIILSFFLVGFLIVFVSWRSHTTFLNPDTTLLGKQIALGRLLFYDPILSVDNSISCASCHKQEFAFSDTARFSKGVYGRTITRNSMSLINLKWQNKFFWDGRVTTLEEQVLKPIVHPNEMGQDLKSLVVELSQNKQYSGLFLDAFGKGTIDSTQISMALASFLRTIVSMNSPMDKVFEEPKNRTINEHVATDGAQSDLAVMKNLFEKSLTSQILFLKSALKQKNGKFEYSDRALSVFVICIQCHDKNFLGDAGLMKNSGLEKVSIDKGLGAITKLAKDEGLFKVPTFRNVLKTPPYMHDGRFKTIDEVLEHYSTGIQDHPNLDPLLKEDGKPVRFNLTVSEKEEIKEFLRLAEDDSLFINPKFSNPFLTK
jgi:cytochrome c peroxidase